MRPEFEGHPEIAVGAGDMSPWFFARGEEPGVYGGLHADRYSGAACEREGRVDGEFVGVLHPVRDEGEDPHPDVYQWIDEEEAELAPNLVPRAIHFSVGY